MRVAQVSALVAFSVLLAATQAQASAPPAPSKEVLRTMSDAEFRAFLAKPATQVRHAQVEARQRTCPDVTNDGIAAFFWRMFGGR